MMVFGLSNIRYTSGDKRVKITHLRSPGVTCLAYLDNLLYVAAKQAEDLGYLSYNRKKVWNSKDNSSNKRPENGT